MKGYVTYCSAKKRPDPGALPSIERYISKRIGAVAGLAGADNVHFRILSGKYGLLKPEDIIPPYEHLLKIEEVEALVGKVIGQLGGLQEVTFFYELEDPATHPYLETMRRACEIAGTSLILRRIRKEGGDYRL